MKKRFIVGADPMSQEQNKQFIEYLRGRKCGWWHWINNFWLVADPAGKVTPTDLRDELKRISPEARILVLTTHTTKGWAGKGPNGERKNMFNWLRDTWGKD